MKILLTVLIIFGVISCRDYPGSQVFNLRTQEALFNLNIDLKTASKKQRQRKQHLQL
jgi:hypothetical protein